MQNATALVSPSSTTTAPVVQNDTAPNASAAVPTYKFARIEQLAIDRQAWETTAYRTSNEMLYGLLQKCYQLYKDMEGSGDDAKKLREALAEHVHLKGYKFLKSTHTISKIVKCVFSDSTSNDSTDRRRVSAYSLVLQKALQDGLAANQIAAFIANAGGVEAIRLGKKPNTSAVSTKQKASEAKATIATRSVGVAVGLQLGAQLDAGKIGSYVVLIGTWQADGSVIAHAVVQNEGVINSALASCYTSNKSVMQATAVETKAANDANAQLTAITQAAAA